MSGAGPTERAVREPGLCRLCTAYCPILVDIDDGRAVAVAGNPEAGFHGGYTCPKGRALPEQHYGEARLLRSMKREGEGHRPIASETAMDEIAARIDAILRDHGPRSVAFYFGMGTVPQPAGVIVGGAWMAAIGSRMMFSAGSIDKPGILVAQALHGLWQGGEPAFHEADAWLIVGANPVISKGPCFPMQNPGKLLNDAVERGLQLVVIDPRRTETARRATLHLQPRPGTDPAILAALIHVVLRDGLEDAGFVEANLAGREALAAAAAPFDPDTVARLAGVEAADIVAAAHIFAAGRNAGVSCGTGPSFASYSTLTEYLGLCLTSLCGRWRRAGERVGKPNVLLPPNPAKAQPWPPYPAMGYGEQLRVRGLGGCASGLSAAALADEILLPGEGKVRALICVGSNPMMAWPDQHRAHEALRALDLLVTVDYEMNATARLAHYVIAPKLTLETPATTWLPETAKYAGTHRGLDRPFAQYTPALVTPPEGADVIEEWEFFHGLARRQGLQLEPVVSYGMGQHCEHPPTRFKLDMARKPDSDTLLDLIHAHSRVPLSDVRTYRHGHIFDEIDAIVAPRDPDNEDRMDVGNAEMMAQLADVLAGLDHAPAFSNFPFSLVSRRSNAMLNSAFRSNERLNRKRHNPLAMHPDDLAGLGLSCGEAVTIRSSHGAIAAIVEGDATLRPGVVSMTHGFGGNPGEDDDPRAMGSNTGRLVSPDVDYDPISGMPRLGGVPVAITPLQSAA